jgi:hypothetical protein
VPVGEEFTVQLQLVLADNIIFITTSNSNKLPTYWQGRRQMNPTAREDTDHEGLLVELERRDVFDYKEYFSNMDDDNNDPTMTTVMTPITPFQMMNEDIHCERLLCLCMRTSTISCKLEEVYLKFYLMLCTNGYKGSECVS